MLRSVCEAKKRKKVWTVQYSLLGGPYIFGGSYLFGGLYLFGGIFRSSKAWIILTLRYQLRQKWRHWSLEIRTMCQGTYNCTYLYYWRDSKGSEYCNSQIRTSKRRRCKGSGGGLGTDPALVFWDTGNCQENITCRPGVHSVCEREYCMLS